MFKSRFMPCPECGGSVDRIAESGHLCTSDRLFDFQMFGLRDEVAAVESQLHSLPGHTMGTVRDLGRGPRGARSPLTPGSPMPIERPVSEPDGRATTTTLSW